MTTTDMARKTLIAGIIVGAAGILGTLLSGLIFSGLYNEPTMNSDWFFLFNSLISLLISVCLPFSAALVAASLVMRHTEALTGRSSAPCRSDAIE